MKALRVFALMLSAGVWLCRAEDVTITNSGWFGIGSLAELGQTNVPADPLEELELGPLGIPVAPNLAEAVTPEIQALADGLQRDPVRIVNYVHDHIRHVLYFGSKKGAQLTLLEKSGNDFDQCALLVALLRASGFADVGYGFGWMLVPYESPNGDQRDLRHWLGLELVNTNWHNTTNYLWDLFITLRAYPRIETVFGTNTLGVQRVWVTLKTGGVTNYLDPAFKITERATDISLAAAMGFSSNALMSAAGGNCTADYTTNLNEAALRGALAGYTTNLLNYIQSHSPNASVEEILGARRIVPSTNTALSQSLLFPVTNLYGTMPVVSWTYQPTNLMSTLAISFSGTNHQFFIPQLQGGRLSLTVSSSGTAQLWLEDTLLAQRSTGGGSGTFGVTLAIGHPKGGWNTTNNVFIPGTVGTTTTTGYQKANANYALVYAFEPDWGWLQRRQRQLEAYRQRELADTSREVLTETLNVMGLNWTLQAEAISQVLASQIGVLPQFCHRAGRMAQETGWGYYVDIYAAMNGTASSAGEHDGRPGRWMDHFCYFGSAMEHGLIEQLQSSNLVGASTIKLLQLANTNGQQVFLATTNNWAAVRPQLVNWDLAWLDSFVNGGYKLLLPRNGSTQLAGSGSWTGYGLWARSKDFGLMLIGDPQHNGGFVSDLGAKVNPPYVNLSGYAQPLYYRATPAMLPAITAADPVNMAEGTFQSEGTDLALGAGEPNGLRFNRYYSSSRRNSNLAGIAPGWIHNYYLKATPLTAPEAALGATTPAQMAAMLVATCSALNLYNGAQPDPKNWMVNALIAKWGIDQLTGNAVSVSLGQDTVQFIRQPDGGYTPPANCTLTLLKTNSVFWLRERNGRTFKFNRLGWGTNICDQYDQGVRLTYGTGALSNWVSTATDAQGRSLTFSYSSSTPRRLTSVSGPAGSVALGYSAGNDLYTVADPEGKTNKFICDTNHQITAAFNGLGQLVVSNLYNAFGRVATQYTAGDLNRAWRIYCSGWETVERDPAGGERRYYYDDKTRLIGLRDALGNLSRTFYDGQDHVVMTVSPLNETNISIFDGRHNRTAAVDPLGFTNTFVYDGQDRLVRAVDARGNASTFGFNSKHQLIGATNGAGDWVAFGYDASQGTLTSRTDSGGTTSFAYDGWDQLSGITYPDSLGSEGFLNSASGDVLSHTNARGFVTSYQYNLRRELTNTIAPTNVTSRIAFDAAGNVWSTTDARGFTVSNTWSATKKLLATRLPATPQGVPAVTNTYDNRDWLLQTINPQQSTINYSNDAAGRPLSVTDPVARTTRFRHDADGRVLGVTNAALEAALSQWSARGELLKTTDAALHTVLHTYDPAGNRVTLTNRNGRRWQFQFDAANRLTNTLTPRLASTKLAYNNRGLLQSVTEPTAQPTTFGYDAKGRTTNLTDQVGVKTFAYDANNNLTNLTQTINSQPSTINYTYDGYDRVSSYRDADGNLIQYRYDLNGNLTNLVYPGGRSVYYSFDSLNRLTNVTDWGNRKTSIEYDLASRVKKITRPNGTVREVDYDPAGQTTNIVERTSGNVPIALFRLNWNSVGRVAWEFTAPLPHPYTPPSRTMTYNEDNQISTFNGQTVVHDADGNMTSGPLTNSTLTSYNYDARNRLRAVGGVDYGYDPGGNRTAVTNSANVTRFVINPNAALSQVLVRTRGSTTSCYIYGLGLLYEITETATSTNTLTYHFDYRGSTIALTDGNGSVKERFEYSAYGTLTYRSDSTDTPFLYNGRYGVQTDPNGLLYMRARYYNPYLCRFINPDPAGFTGGLNFYAYADGNPISLIDPFGLGAIGEGGGSSWVNRGWGALGAVGGGLTAAFGYTFGTVTAPTVAGGIAGAAIGTYGLDMFQAGIRQMWTGQNTPTMLNSTLQSAGMSPTAAAWTSGGIGVALTGGASIYGAYSSTVNSVPSLVTATHFTDEAGMVAISRSGTVGTPTLQPYVTLPSQIPAGATASTVERILEIQAGRGQYSISFQTPAANLVTPANGALTSGGAQQFQLLTPAPINPANFIRTP
jgi:RHS repeat-associated protein